MEEFVVFLGQLSLADNVIRKAAEERYESLCSGNGDELPHMLLGVISDTSVVDTVRRLAAVLLRRFLIQE